MSEKKALDFIVVRYTALYKDQTMRLLNLLWSSKTEEESRARFKWKYEDNPYTQPPLIFLAMVDGKVIGVLGHMVEVFLINGAKYNVCTPVDGIVSPEYRMYGVYLKMSAEAI